MEWLLMVWPAVSATLCPKDLFLLTFITTHNIDSALCSQRNCLFFGSAFYEQAEFGLAVFR